MNKLKLLLFLLLTTFSGVFAQDLSKLTPEQIEMYKQYMSGGTVTKTNTVDNVVEERIVNDITENKVVINKAGVFGSQLFNNKNLTFEPKLNIATPPKYILGTYDELLIDISGLYEANYNLKVSPEGTIRIPNVGMIKVGGVTIDNATRNIKNQLTKIYMGVASGETRINVSLGNIRSIRITIVGEAVRPGTYTLPSLATAFNALYACGGPSEIGSMRDIKVLRHGKLISSIDIYSFLTTGVMSGDVALQDDDVIRIEPYKIIATIFGGVKHIGRFEVLPNESLQQLLKFAGGFSDDAYKGKLTVMRLTETEKTVINVDENQFSSFPIKSGDSIFILTKYKKYDNRVDIKGSVFRPGAYSLEPGLTLKQLIAKAEGIKEDAYLNMASITRKKENKIPEIIGFNLGEILSGKSPDILLQKDDQIEIRSLFAFREGESVSIWGAVKSPGKFSLIENITLKDLIFKARGFTEMAMTDSIELIRIEKDPFKLRNNNTKSKVMKFSLDKDLNLREGFENILLENGDQVIVRDISGYEAIRMVKVDGEVNYPGSYNIINKAERISDVLLRSGGVTKYANTIDAFLIRTDRTNPVERKLNTILSENIKNQLESQANNKMDATILKNDGINTEKELAQFDSLQSVLSGADVVNEIFNPEGIVGIDMKDILNNPGGKNDMILEDGDIIYVPRQQQTVRVVGQVLFPTLIRYDKGASLKDYISSAGGFSERAQRKRLFVLYANGTAKSTKKFMGIYFYPQVKQGARIIVPEKPILIRNKMTTGEMITILSSVTSATALIYSIINNSISK